MLTMSRASQPLQCVFERQWVSLRDVGKGCEGACQVAFGVPGFSGLAGIERDERQAWAVSLVWILLAWTDMLFWLQGTF